MRALFFLALLAGCDHGATSSVDAGGDAASVNLDGGTTFVRLPPSGSPIPTTATLHGPGLVLMGGGTDVDAAFVWMHDTIAGSSTTKLGNVVVLRADDDTDNEYTPYIYGLAPFQSVTTLFVGGSAVNGPVATAADLAIAAHYVDEADAVFFAGGDQADYVSWKGSPLIEAVADVYARGGVVGGTSAGCAILGAFVFDSIAADAAGGGDVETSDALMDPFESTISFSRGLFAFPPLADVITDMHFVTRDRMGRLATFVARQYADGAASVVGIGVDESNALVVDRAGKAMLLQQPSGSEAAAGSGAYIVRPPGPADVCTRGMPLTYTNLDVTRASTYDFSRACGSGARFSLSIHGASASPYSTSPYTTAGTTTSCP